MTASRLYAASKTLLFVYVVLRYTGKSWRHLRARGLTGTIHGLYLQLARYLAGLVMLAPPAKRRIASELAQAQRDLRSKLAPPSDTLETNAALPRTGKPLAWITEELDRLKELHAADWQKGRVSGAIYHGHTEGQIGEVIEQGVLLAPSLSRRNGMLTFRA
jgi:sphinganine-1-phosphate aldolase